MRRYHRNHEEYPFLLNKHQQFDLIRGAWCSASRGTETLELFVNKYLYHLRPEMVDFLWAMVYRDLYLPYVTDNAHLSPSLITGGGKGGGSPILHFLAAFNIRNWARLVIKDPDGNPLGVLTYQWHGDYYVIKYPTAFAGTAYDDDVDRIYYPWSSIVSPDIILSRLPNTTEQNHINHQLSLITHSAYEDISLYK